MKFWLALGLLALIMLAMWGAGNGLASLLLLIAIILLIYERASA